MNELDIMHGLYGRFAPEPIRVADMQHDIMYVDVVHRIHGLYKFSHAYLMICYCSGDLDIMEIYTLRTVKSYVNESALKIAPTHVFASDSGCFVVFAQKCFFIDRNLQYTYYPLKSAVCGEFLGILVDSNLNTVLNNQKQNTQLLAALRKAIKPFRKRVTLIRSTNTYAVVCLEDGRLLQYTLKRYQLQLLDFPFCNPEITSVDVYLEDVIVITKNDAVVRYKLQQNLVSSQLAPNLYLCPTLVRTSSTQLISAGLIFGYLVVGNCGPFESFYTAGVLVSDYWVALPGSGQIFRFVACFEDEQMIVLGGDNTISFLLLEYASYARDCFQTIKQGDTYKPAAYQMQSSILSKLKLSQKMNIQLGSPNYSFAYMSYNMVDSQTTYQAAFAGLYTSYDFMDLGGISMLDNNRPDEPHYRQSGLL